MGKLIIDGNAVYEIDENCMQKKQRRRERMNRHPWEATGEDRYRSQRKDAAADSRKNPPARRGARKPEENKDCLVFFKRILINPGHLP